ncbi:zinc finger, CCHC-type containing protein [Tanacetum coccineum]
MFICNAVMTIDKSWTTISNRNSEEFLDGLFAFIKHCKPLLHPITQKIHCPCSRCCNRDDNRVTLEILEDDVETRFNRLGRNDDGLPEEEPNKFQVFRSACKLTGRMKATRLTTDVRQAVVWFVLNNSPEVDADILAYREKSPDNVETNFPAWFNHKIREKKVNDGCSEELFSLACGPISTCTYPACIVNGVKFVVHERDIPSQPNVGGFHFSIVYYK